MTLILIFLLRSCLKMLNKNNLKYPMECVVAMNEDRIIGDGNKLLWHLPGDLKRLKSMTMGAPLIMGRKTWESIGRPLPGRANIVLTRSNLTNFNGAIVVNSFDEAIQEADKWIKNEKHNPEVTVQKKIFLFGGSEIYNLGIDFCDVIQMTKVQINITKGAKFPKLNDKDWKKTKLQEFHKNINSPEFSYWHYQRVN
jgi:dihydrofolate reductase